MIRYRFFYLLFVLVVAFSCSTKTKNLVLTESKNVYILNDSFAVVNKKEVPVYRNIWIYLPPGYYTTKERYPVIYMHDGQNLFDAKASYAGEWKVDETLNEVYRETGKGFIVVGIENVGSERLNEYSPWLHKKYGGGMGNTYMNMLLSELKPKIDASLRTRPEPENTAIIGSSMGGLISYYGGIKHPDMFGKIGALSPSFWFSKEVVPFTKQFGKLQNTKLYLLVGGKEGGAMVSDMKAVENLLRETGFNPKNLKSKLVPDASHNEVFWGSEFKNVISWLFDLK